MLQPTCLLVVVLNAYFANCNKIVDTDKGKVQGHIVTYGNLETLAFLGIPYAAAMTRNNRFKAPLPAKPWTGVLKADRRVMCIQWQNGIISGVENCLVVNVFTPTNITKTLLPVIVSIHGGGFHKGHGHQEGKVQFLEKGFIQVSFNSRLGALGYLCLRNKEAPGNAGLKDQVAALKWVQRNIAYFGGDPAQVTLIGHSSGGVRVHLLILSKMSKGLFQRAVLNGGSALSFWGLDYDPISTAKYISDSLNFQNAKDDLGLLAKFFQSLGADVLATKSGKYVQDFFTRYGRLGFVPCVERPTDGSEAFLSRHPFSILNENQYNDVPTILSFNSFESYNLLPSIYVGQFRDKIENNFEDYLPLDLEFKSNDTKKRTAQILKNAYTHINTLGEPGYVKFLSDSLVTYSIVESAKLHSKYTTVYLLEFAVQSHLQLSNNGKAEYGSFTDHFFTNLIPSDPRVKLAMERAMSLLENFIKFGNPIPTQTDLLPVIWPVVQPEGPATAYLRLEWTVEILVNPSFERMKLWQNIYRAFRRIE